jgi:hypothetical protein
LLFGPVLARALIRLADLLWAAHGLPLRDCVLIKRDQPLRPRGQRGSGVCSARSAAVDFTHNGVSPRFSNLQHMLDPLEEIQVLEENVSHDGINRKATAREQLFHLFDGADSWHAQLWRSTLAR